MGCRLACFVQEAHYPALHSLVKHMMTGSQHLPPSDAELPQRRLTPTHPTIPSQGAAQSLPDRADGAAWMESEAERMAAILGPSEFPPFSLPWRRWDSTPVKHLGSPHDFFFLPLPPLSRAAVPAGPARVHAAGGGEPAAPFGEAGTKGIAGDALGVD
jgi:hypothetical protein